MSNIEPRLISRAEAVARVFSPSRLTLARQIDGKTKRQLAESIGKSPAAVTQFELGQASPTGETLARCAQTLSFPVNFFEAGRAQLSLDTGSVHFRSLRATRAYQRQQAVGYVALLWEVVESIERFVELPIVDLPLSGAMQSRSPAQAAHELRELWGLAPGPLPHLVRHAEARGIIVSVLPRTLASESASATPEHTSGIGNVDAFSASLPLRPFVGLAGAKGGLLRRRFNIAHELGHLVMHPEAIPGDQHHEREAHLFAAELLMPEEVITDELPPRPELTSLVQLQKRWGSSVSALCFRGRILGKYTEEQQRRMMITLNQLGWRTNEPEDERLLTGEHPALLSRALDLASSRGLTVIALAEKLALPPALVRTLLGILDNKPRLTIVPCGPD